MNCIAFANLVLQLAPEAEILCNSEDVIVRVRNRTYNHTGRVRMLDFENGFLPVNQCCGKFPLCQFLTESKE